MSSLTSEGQARRDVLVAALVRKLLPEYSAKFHLETGQLVLTISKGQLSASAIVDDSCAMVEPITDAMVDDMVAQLREAMRRGEARWPAGEPAKEGP